MLGSATRSGLGGALDPTYRISPRARVILSPSKICASARALGRLREADLLDLSMLNSQQEVAFRAG
jgi:hypothetical protein